MLFFIYLIKLYLRIVSIYLSNKNYNFGNSTEIKCKKITIFNLTWDINTRQHTKF